MPNADYALTHSTCRWCGEAITHGGSLGLAASVYWFSANDSAFCPDGENTHEPTQNDSYPTCSEGDHPNDDNPGKPMCKTCEDWT